MQSLNFYSLHVKSFNKKFTPSYIKYKRQQFQIDLVDLNNIEKHNAGIRYLLTVICSFTKKAWAFPLKNKSADEVLNRFINILRKIKIIPHSILSDSGKEFRNKFFLEYCMTNNISTFEAHSSFHGSIIERFNQTLKV